MRAPRSISIPYMKSTTAASTWGRHPFTSIEFSLAPTSVSRAVLKYSDLKMSFALRLLIKLPHSENKGVCFDELALAFQGEVGMVPVVAQLDQLGLEEGGGGLHTGEGNFHSLKFM